MVDVQAIIAAVVAEAEQACRYTAKHNSDNMEPGPYRDGFEIACEVCEGAIARHVQHHMWRILEAAQINPPGEVDKGIPVKRTSLAEKGLKGIATVLGKDGE